MKQSHAEFGSEANESGNELVKSGSESNANWERPDAAGLNASNSSVETT